MIKEGLKFNANVHVELRGPDGKIKEVRDVHNLVVNAGLTHIATLFGPSPDTAMSHMAIGTSNTPAAPGQTALVSELDRNAFQSKTIGTYTITYVGFWAAGDGTGNIVEAGIFNFAFGGSMLCRSVFTLVPKGVLDTLTITWVITCST